MKYELTDGHDVFDVRDMTEAEFNAANESAKENTDGNLYWRISPPVKTIRRSTSNSPRRAYLSDDVPF